MQDISNKPVRLPEHYKTKRFIQSGVISDWSTDYYKVKELHEMGLDGEGVKIGYVDTGFINLHPFFDDKDIHSDGLDGNDHGTMVATRLLLIAPKASLYSYKGLYDSGGGTIPQMIEAGHKALDEGVHILNFSLGWTAKDGSNKQLIELLERSDEMGTLIFASAGNGYSTGKDELDLPAGQTGIISVGSYNKRLIRSTFSDASNKLDIYASGQGTIAIDSDGDIVTFDGTSSSSPTAAGMAALVKQYLESQGKEFNKESYKNFISCL